MIGPAADGETLQASGIEAVVSDEVDRTADLPAALLTVGDDIKIVDLFFDVPDLLADGLNCGIAIIGHGRKAARTVNQHAGVVALEPETAVFVDIGAGLRADIGS